jgi:hypothetical protein
MSESPRSTKISGRVITPSATKSPLSSIGIRTRRPSREILLNTGEATLVEHTRNDSYWADGGDGSGRNILGKLLMQVRQELRQASAA